jgi:hypothetical protein
LSTPQLQPPHHPTPPTWREVGTTLDGRTPRLLEWPLKCLEMVQMVPACTSVVRVPAPADTSVQGMNSMGQS